MYAYVCLQYAGYIVRNVRVWVGVGGCSMRLPRTHGSKAPRAAEHNTSESSEFSDLEMDDIAKVKLRAVTPPWQRTEESLWCAVNLMSAPWRCSTACSTLPCMLTSLHASMQHTSKIAPLYCMQHTCKIASLVAKIGKEKQRTEILLMEVSSTPASSNRRQHRSTAAGGGERSVGMF
eukprot:1139261-Pelagomonas_calceolata.AAC.2